METKRAAIGRPFFVFMKIAYLLAAVLFIVPSAQAEPKPFLNVHSFSVSEPVSIRSLFNNWEGGFKSGGSRILTDSAVSLGVEHSGWRLSRFERLDYQVSMSDDTAEFVHHVNNKVPLVTGRNYDLSLDVHHLYSRGVSLGYLFDVRKGLTLYASASYLEGMRLTSGSVRGSATATASTEYDFDVDVSYYYSRDALFWRDAEDPVGEGATFELGMDWRPNRQLHMTALLSDIAGWVQWYDTPYTRANGSTDTKSYDENGYQIYKPVVSGIETYKDFRQALPFKARATVSYSVDMKNSVFVGLRHYDVATLYQVGVTRDCAGGTRLGFALNPVYDSVAVTVENQYFSISLESDSLNKNEARLFGVNFSIHYDF